MNKHPYILFTSTFITPFISADAESLAKQYPLTQLALSGIKAVFISCVKIFSADITFSWFASVYSSLLVFFASMLHKKSIIVIGGVDVAKMPDLDYGIWNSRWKSLLVGYGLRNADVVIAVDESLKKDAARNARYSGSNIVVIPTGYDAELWHPGTKKENVVLCVAHCTDRNRLKIKGIDFLFDVARALPAVRFIVVGFDASLAVDFAIPGNVTIHSFVPHHALLPFYQQAKIYFQPSLREGLPNTLCEAMLCECYPIGTNVGGIPTAIGSAGTIIPYGDVSQGIHAIESAFAVKSCPDARDRIKSHFSRNQREEKLFSIIDTVFDAR